MPRELRQAVYNSRIPILGMLIFLLRLLRAAGFVVVAALVFHAQFASAADWSAAEGQLASKIAAVTGPGAVSLEVSNRSSLSRTDSDEISRGLRSQLSTLGLRFVNADQAATIVQVWLSENLQSYVWVAEIHQGAGESSVTMVSVARPAVAPAEHEPSAVTIHKASIWIQVNPVLDVAVVDGNPPNMVVLDPSQVALYKLQNSHWQPEQILPIAHSRPWPRDPRGRLVLRKDHLFDAYLPGVFCRSSNRAPLTMSCYETDDPWPVGTDPFNLSGFFTPSRNYFTGALAPGIGKQTAAPAFYSAAALPRDKYTLWLFAAVDGQLHLLDGLTDQVAGKRSWGSDIASVHTGCGGGWDVLATGNNDGPSDSVRAFEVLDRLPAAVSPPVEFPGRITALWTETNGNNAVAVSRDQEAGNYEAFRLSFTCGQ
jgi:hypothetical protein